MKKRILSAVAILLAVLIVGGTLFHISPPVIRASNIESFHNKISSNAPIIISFNQLMNRSSAEAGFKIEPTVSGHFEWSLNKMIFVPDEKLKISETYKVTVSGDVKNMLGRKLGNDKVLIFTVVNPPKVSLAVPNGETVTDSKITVMFDRPLTSLTTYDESESKDFPLQISPQLDGRFKWIGTAAFQYIPKERFANSTTYTVTIPANVVSLDGGKMEEAFTFTFSTPRIAVVGKKVYETLGKDPYLVRFNQDVNLESVLKNVKVSKIGGEEVVLKAAYQKRNEITYKNGKKIEKEIEDKKVAALLPPEKDWGYDNEYEIRIAKGIAGVEGNLMSESESVTKFRTKAFLANYFPSTGEEHVNPFVGITLYFDQEVNLGEVQDHFSIEPKVELNAAYGKKCDPNWDEVKSSEETCPEIKDSNVVIFTPKNKLQNLSKYMVKLDKEMKTSTGVSYLKEDIFWSFKTADVLKVLRTTPAAGGTGSYKQICVYTSNQIDEKDVAKQIIFEPAGKSKIQATSYRFDGKGGDYYDDNGYLDCKKPAKENSPERFALDIRILLDPSTQQTFTLKGAIKDTFGQTLGADFVAKFKTEALKDTDTNLEILQKDFLAVATIDQHAKPVFAARNLNNFDLEVCKLSAEKVIEIETEYARVSEGGGYQAYANYGWNAFTPSEENCLEYKRINEKVKNVYWEKQYIEVDLEKDLGHGLQAGSYYIRASSPQVYRIQNDYKYDELTGQSVNIGTKKVIVHPDQILALTNLHLAVKKSAKNVLFWVTDIKTGQPVSGAEIKLFTRTGAPLEGSSSTGKDGIAKRDLNGLPFTYATAEKNGEKIVLNSDVSDGISPWDYNLSYSELRRYTQGYIYTERPLYQPTHQVFFKGILRDDNDAVLKLPEAKNIDVEITDSRGTSIYKKNLPVTAAGTFADSLKLDEKASLGRYSIATCLRSDPKYGDCLDGNFYNSFFVEEYRKPEYEMKVSFSKDNYVNKEEINATLDAKYFFGAPVPNAKVSWSLKAQNYYFDAYNEEWFSFTNNETFRKCYFGCPYNDSYLATKEGVLNDNGQLTVNHKIDLSEKDQQGKPKPPDSSKIYTLEATVSDANNQSVTGRKEVIVNRGEFYVGVKNEEYIVSAGQKMPIKVIAVDYKGTPLSGKSIDLELAKVDWKYVKKKNLDGTYYWDNELNQKVVSNTSVTTGGDGKETYKFSVDEGGEYLVTATGHDSLGNVFSSTVDFYATTSEVVNWKQENNNRMELKLDKMDYKVGDTAKLFVKSPYAKVKALLTFERGNIFESKVVDIESNAHVIEIPITEKMIPNFYVSVLEAKAGNKTDPPDFKLGYANVVVDAKAKALNISVKPDKERYQPRDTVNLEITTTNADGKPVAADLSIAAVDASLLALKGNPVRNLIGLFYSSKPLGITTADNLTSLLERINISDLKGSKGGAGKGADELAKPRGEFEDTAYWKSALVTNANGKVTASFKLPDNLTTWNIEVIGSTTNSLFGSVNKEVTSAKALMVRPVLPRFALFKDKIKLGAIVHNFTDSNSNVTLTLDVKNLEVSGSKEKSVNISKGGSAKILWEVSTPKVENGTLAEITFSAKGNGASDSVIQSFPIYSYSTPETVALSSFTDDLSFTEKVLLPDSIDPELGELKITTGATLATYISSSLNYLLTYPYGCTEQLLSSLLPNVVLKNAVALPGLSDKLKLTPIRDVKNNIISFDTLVSKTLQRLYAFQRDDGGFGYFQGVDSKSYPYLTAYFVFGANQVKKAGYSVDGTSLGRAVSYLQNYMRSDKDLELDSKGKKTKKNTYWANNRAYMLFVMSEIGQADVGLTNSLYGDRALLSNGGKAYLAMTLNKISAGSANVKELIKSLENQARIDARGTYVRNDIGSSFDMMTHTKVTALTVQALTRIDPTHPLLPKMISWLIKVRKDGRWETTQDNVTALIALAEYLKQTKETEANYSATINIDGSIEKQYAVNNSTILDTQEVVKAISELKLGGDGTEINFSKEGNGRIYYDMVLKYFLPIEKIAPRSEGFNIERKYYSATDTKMENPLKEAKVGETLHGRITVVVPEERNFVAIEDFLPAGFELVNFEFENTKRSLQDTNYESDIRDMYVNDEVEINDGYYFGYSPWNYKEIRADRLFLFADRLSKGVYEYDYYVQVTSEGQFHNPPTVVSEMYFPENFGRTEGDWMNVKE